MALRGISLALPLLALALAAPAAAYYYGRGGYGGSQQPPPQQQLGGPGTRQHRAAAPHQHQHPHPHPHPRHPRHPSPRHSHLERLLSRLDAAAPVTPGPSTAPPPAHATAPLPPAHRPPAPGPGSHHRPAASYEDEDEDEYDDFDDEEDDDDTEAEEADGEGDRAASEMPQGHQPSALSPVSQSKWDTMGTRTGVDELRRMRIAGGGAKSPHASVPGYAEAVEHLLRVNREGDCKVPKPRLVQVKNEYPHPSKIYLPRCTILHQCGDDTGCCNAESLTCVPRQTHRVDLFFYTTTVGSSGPSGPQRVERLSFYNHTECGCEDRYAGLLPRDHAHILRKSSRSRGLFQPPQQPKAERSPPPAPSCKCPAKYAARPSRDGLCSCDCFDKQRDCLRLKKGKDFFSVIDRQCIQKGDCKVPSCEFGTYLRLAGRCPKKRERFEVWKQ